MKICIYSGEPFLESNGEHILQNFLGARWTSKKIVCNQVQALFGESIDLALEQGLRSFRSLLGTKSGRRDAAPSLKHIKGSQGNSYHLKPGGVPYLSRPNVQTTSSKDGTHNVRIRISDKSQFDWAMAEVARIFPSIKLDIPAWKASMKATDEYMTEQLLVSSSIGGHDYFRGLLKAAFNLLGEEATHIALQPCFDEARAFILSGTGEIAQHIRWPSTTKTLPVPTLGQFDHVVFIHSRKNKVEGFIDFLAASATWSACQTLMMEKISHSATGSTPCGTATPQKFATPQLIVALSHFSMTAMRNRTTKHARSTSAELINF